MKTVDLEIRPIHHRLSDRVRAHVFLCMLAYHVEWQMRALLAPMLDENAPAHLKSSTHLDLGEELTLALCDWLLEAHGALAVTLLGPDGEQLPGARFRIAGGAVAATPGANGR